MTTETPLAVGICSTAHVHTDSYAGILTGMEGVHLVGITDTDADRGTAAAERHGTEFVSSDDLLASVDAAVVCSINAHHLDWVRRCATAGVDILCEKPLAPTVEEARETVEVVNDAGIELGVAMPLRFSPPVQRASDAFDAGDVGEVHSISGTNRGKLPGGWFTDPDAAGGGAVMDHSVHLVDLVHHLTGERVAEVYCLSGTRFHDVPVDDVNVLSMELTDGTQFLLDGSWSRPEEWHFWGDAALELVGDDGTVAVDCFGQTLTHTADEGELSGANTVFWGDDPDAGLIADFVDAVRNERSPAVTPEEGLDAVRVVAAAYRSHRIGEPVTVDY